MTAARLSPTQSSIFSALRWPSQRRRCLSLSPRTTYDTTEVAAVAVYTAGFLAMFSFSAAYNLWPISPIKWWLRRCDHSAIYLLIAATYTAFMLPMRGVAPTALLTFIWIAALTGIAIKLLWPGRFDRTAVGVYLAMGWSCLSQCGRSLRRSRRSRSDFSLPVACFIRWASFFMRGPACAFRMRSGTVLSLPPLRVITRPC